MSSNKAKLSTTNFCWVCFSSVGLVKVYTDINWIEFSFQTGYTSLHLAAQNCHCKSLELLLKGGANPIAKNNVCLFYKCNFSFIRSYLLVLRRCNKLTMEAMLFVFKDDVTRNDSERRFFNSVTQHYNIVATLFRMVATLLQHCNAALR